MENYRPESPMSGSVANNNVEDAARTADLAKQAAREAIESGKAYAKDAVNAAGKKLTAAREQAARAAEQGTQYVTAQPIRAVAMAAAGGAILGALLLNAMRGRR